MTKQEYFEQLLDCLPAITPEDEQQIYEYYDELICDGMEEGNSEEEMLAQFGNPKVLAERLQEEWELSALPSKTEGLVSIDEICEDSQHFSCDEKNYCYTSDQVVNCLDFTISNYSFCAVPSSDQNLRIYFPKELKKQVQILENNGELQFICKPKKQEWLHLFRPFPKTGSILLEIPQKKIQTLHASVRNASISVQDNTFEELILKASNASINGKTLKARHLEFVSSNASLHLENSTCTNAVLKTSNGGIHVTSVSGGTLHCKTSNAKIHAADTSASELKLITSNATISARNCSASSILLQTSNGKIAPENLLSNDITLVTSNGSINGTISGKEEDYTITCQTSNGSCHPTTTHRPNTPGTLTATSSNGSIRLTFTN